MALYRTIHLTFWTDPKVDDLFTPEDKYFYLYLLTNPHTNIAGCYEIGSKQLMRETGYSEDMITRLLGRMQYDLDVIRYDPETKEVLLLNWWKYNWTKSANLIKAVQQNLLYIKNESFRNYLQQLLNNERHIAYPDPIDTPSIPSTDPMPTSVAVADSVTGTVTDSTGQGYPDREQLRNFCLDHGMTEDFAKELFDRYSGNGWTMDSGEPIRNWRNVVLSAWRKAKKSGRKEPAPAGKKKAPSYSPDDLVEYPYGSGLYRLRSEVEGMTDG